MSGIRVPLWAQQLAIDASFSLNIQDAHSAEAARHQQQLSTAHHEPCFDIGFGPKASSFQRVLNAIRDLATTISSLHCSPE